MKFLIKVAFALISSGASAATLGTGGTGGTYYPLGAALAQQLNSSQSIHFEAAVTKGGDENVQRVISGDLDFGIAMAHQIANKSDALRVIARLHGYKLHLVVRDDGTIKSPADLKNKRVMTGRAGSLSIIGSSAVLAAYGLGNQEVELVEQPSFSVTEMTTSIVRGDVDAFFWFGSIPTAGISDLLTTSGYRLLDIDPPLNGEWNSSGFFQREAIPANAYNGQKKDVKTISTYNFLFGRENSNGHNVRLIAGSLEKNRETYASKWSWLGGWSPNISATMTTPVPLHQALNVGVVKRQEKSPSLKRAEVPTTIGIDQAIEKCRELGIKQNTERFGECVLKLSR